jgi:hypothetical protein
LEVELQIGLPTVNVMYMYTGTTYPNKNTPFTKDRIFAAPRLTQWPPFSNARTTPHGEAYMIKR